jgi:transcriptional regulator with XRE-family HTH domain
MKRTPSAASELLKEALNPKVISRADLAAKLGVSRQAVSDWLNGDALPTADRMAQLEDLLGIPMRSWTEPVPSAEPATETGS